MNRFVTTTDVIYNKYIKKDITIAHISDIHFNTHTKKTMLDKMRAYLLAMKPDYLMITGDTVDVPRITNNKEKIKELVTFLTETAKKTKILISIGNHDVMTDESFRFFRELDQLDNIYVLDNKSYQDENIYVAGFTLSNDYYYNITGSESKELLIEYFDNHHNIINNLPKNLPKVALIHSPIKLADDEVLAKLKEYDLILCGHMHNGLVPRWLYFIFKGNLGLIGPNNRFFPKIAKGKIEKYGLTIIINGAITKFSKQAGVFFSKINFIYNKSVNKIIIRKKRGIDDEN